MSWTHHEAMMHEVALDCLRDMIGARLTVITEERRKPSSDPRVIEFYQAQIKELLLRQRKLGVHDYNEIARAGRECEEEHIKGLPRPPDSE